MFRKTNQRLPTTLENSNADPRLNRFQNLSKNDFDAACEEVKQILSAGLDTDSKNNVINTEKSKPEKKLNL